MKPSPKLNICITTDAWKPLWGGGQEHIWQVSQRLAEDYGFNVDILASNFGPENESHLNGKLKVFRLGPKFNFPNFFGRLLYLLASLKFQLANSYDVYNCQSHDTLFLIPLVKLFHPRAKFVLTLHGQALTPLHFLWDKMVHDFPFDVILTAAKSTLTRKVKAKNLVVIGNGVNTEDFDKVKSHKRDRFTVVWAGRPDDSVKGVIYLKEALKDVPLINLDLISGVPHSEVIRRFKSSDLFVLPSLSEGLPLTLLEAMAAKLPVVSTNVGDCEAVITKAGCGIIVPKGDSQSLKEAILELYHSKDRQKLGQKGYTFVKATYTWKNIASIYYGQLTKA